MKPSTVPFICGTALAAMSAAALSHWSLVNDFVAVSKQGFSQASAVVPRAEQAVAAPPASEVTAIPVVTEQAPAVAAEGPQKDFYEALISRMEGLQNQNRDLLDQMAETNRDLMKLEFRVDTHSESFRPMPVSEEGSFTSSFEDDLGVLPPRAEPVFLPDDE